MSLFRRTFVVVCLTSACIKGNPARGLPATGQPLMVRLESGTAVNTTNDVVGSETVTHKDGSMSTVDVRADVDHAYQWEDYSYYEGSAAIDEQDFYRLAGDRDSEERVRHRRAAGKKMQRIGLGSMALGLAIGGGLSALGISKDSTGLAIGGLVGGVLVFSFGAALYGGGRSAMTRKVIDTDTAKTDADLVEVCVQGSCATPSEGGRKYRDASDATESTDEDTGSEPVAAEPRPSAPTPRPLPPVTRPPAPAAPSGPLVGRWHGTITLMIAQKGQTPSTQSDEITFEIEKGPAAMVTFWPNIEQKEDRCRFTAAVSGKTASFKPRVVCTVEEGDRETTLLIKSGSLEQKGNTLSVKLVLDASVRDLSAGKNAKAVMGTMTYSGSGTLVH